jgi:hypothetical protein
LLMARCSDGHEEKHPQLVSFVGQTSKSESISTLRIIAKRPADAGKSTLIKMLIKLEENRHNTSSYTPFETPVVGLRRNDKTPTSVDVHLYADPDTSNTPTPLLYADCEGLDGGEVRPRAATHRKDNIRRQIIFGGRIRRLEWATSDEKRGRKYMVRELYPRLLYTFSDVVVFVLRNSKLV